MVTISVDAFDQNFDGSIQPCPPEVQSRLLPPENASGNYESGSSARRIRFRRVSKGLIVCGRECRCSEGVAEVALSSTTSVCDFHLIFGLRA
jgi:hypothetical protein